MDRNGPADERTHPDVVALRKESVDRNQRRLSDRCFPTESLSARRAWIEMPGADVGSAGQRSLSARRAWIEMQNTRTDASTIFVALRKESVDRNFILS